jgi:hypothetical protein
MNPDEARLFLARATADEDGVFTQLRLGKDPGHEQMLKLRLALRVLWKKWKSHDLLPVEIVRSAATILNFKEEARSNLKDLSDTIRGDRGNELEDLVIGAYDLLVGDVAEQWTVRRADLGE